MPEGEYPALMVQELDQIVAGQNAGFERITWTFPPVPQSLAWTGSISVVPTVQDVTLVPGNPTNPNPTIFFGDMPLLQIGEYCLLKNGIPMLYWQGLNSVYNVRATSQDVIQLIGMFPNSLVPAEAFSARWMGQSVPAEQSPFVWPELAGTAPGPTQIYTNPQGPANNNNHNFARPLTTVSYPLPGTPLAVVNDQRMRPPVLGSAVLLPAASGGTNGFYLYELALELSVAQLSTVTGEQDWLVQIVQTVGGNILTGLNISTVPGTADTDSIHIPMHGLAIPNGDGLTVTFGAYGGTEGGYYATAVYTQNNGQPG